MNLSPRRLLVDQPDVEADAFHDYSRTSFGGFTAAQQWCDAVLWESILNVNPQIQGIVEIGSYKGGFSRYLSAQAMWRGIEFKGYEVIGCDTLPADVEVLDVWRHKDKVSAYLAGIGAVALFCDNGNKARELQTFGAACGDGSLIVVHDWGTEVTEADVPAWAEMVYEEFCVWIRSPSRVFKRKGE